MRAEPPPTRVDDGFRAQARSRPERPAILTTEGLTLSYGDLRGLADDVGNALHQLTVRRGDVVVIVLDGIDFVVALLGLLPYATVVPLSPSLPARDFESLFRRLRPSTVLARPTNTAVFAAAELHGVSIIDVSTGTTSASALMEGRAGLTVRSHPPTTPGETDAPTRSVDPALILPTSGTTALPKLVPLTHTNVLAAAAATCEAYGLSSDDRRLNVMPVSHVQGIVGSILPSLLSGGSVICAQRFDASSIPTWIERLRPTWFSASAAMYRELLIGETTTALTGLRFLRCGSGHLPVSLRAALEKECGIPVIESYGMTEAHQIASTPLLRGQHKPGTIGVATGSEVAILDDGGEPATPGTFGDVIIRGANVMCAYLDDPQLNQSAFVDGWFLTGDIGMLDAEGYLCLLGRRTEIINRGGEKIAPEEVEAALLEHPKVRDAAAFSVSHTVFGEDVAAAVVTTIDEPPGPELRDFLRSRLAPFKIPRRIVAVDELPRTQGGKLLRRELTQFAANTSAPAAGVTGQRSRSMLEIAVAALWKAILDLPDIDHDMDFFALGGDSLQETRLRSAIKQVFRIELPRAAIYEEARSVAAMADVIAGAQGSASTWCR